MAYTKQNFKDGQTLTAECLNRMEDGIAELFALIAQLSPDIDGGDDVTPDTSGIPEDIVAEAERVVSSIQTKIGSNSVTFVAMSDMHEMGDSDDSRQDIIDRYRKANLNAGQAAKLVSDKVGLDFFANLGDLAWGGRTNYGTTTTYHDLMQSIKAAKSYTAAVASANPSFELPGNHDPYLVIEDDNGNYITNEIITGLIGNYKYIDFESKKVRVIGLHTAEYTAGYSSEGRMSGEQLQWFANALDLSAKPDASNWGIIILSHHPLDWGGLGNTLGVLKSYLAGSSYSTTHNGVAVSYNFSGKNMAKVIGNFHGHTHCFRVENIGDTDVQRIAIPNACYGRSNEYSTSSDQTIVDNFSEKTTYNKSENNGKNTAFCVVSINLDTKMIYADCFGAGYDRKVSYVGAEVTTYTVTNNLTNANNSNGTRTVDENAPYVAKITAYDGYELESVVVTMGGKDITATAYSDGNINIASVTGHVVITAIAKAVSVYDVTNLVPTATVVNGTAIYNGVGYKDGYRISSAIGESAESGYVITGQMPYPQNSDGTHKTIYIRGATLDLSDNNCRWTGCPASIAASSTNCVQLSCASTAGASYMLSTYFTIEELATNYYKLTPIESGFSSHTTTVGSMLMSLKGSGANLIITTDEPIE